MTTCFWKKAYYLKHLSLCVFLIIWVGVQITGVKFLKVKVKVKVSNYLSTLVQKRTAYRGTHVGAFNLEFWSQIKQVFSSEETLWMLNLGRKPLTTMTRAGFEPTLLPSRRFTAINRKPYTLTTRPRRKLKTNIQFFFIKLTLYPSISR